MDHTKGKWIGLFLISLVRPQAYGSGIQTLDWFGLFFPLHRWNFQTWLSEVVHIASGREHWKRQPYKLAKTSALYSYTSHEKAVNFSSDKWEKLFLKSLYYLFWKNYFLLDFLKVLVTIYTSAAFCISVLILFFFISHLKVYANVILALSS